MESKFVSRFFMSCGYIWFVNQVETNFETIIIFVFVAMYSAVLLSSVSNVLIFRASFVTTNETNNFLSILLPKLKKIRCRIFVRHNHRIHSIWNEEVLEHSIRWCAYSLFVHWDGTLGFPLLYGNFVKMHVCSLLLPILRLASLSKYRR